jgi:hypothetical protein
MTTQKQLQGLFCLDHNIKLYIPGTANVDKKVDNTRYVVETQALFSKLFGGATSYDAKGSWVSSERGLVVEGVKIVESYATKEQVNAGLEAVIQQAAKIKRELSQETVSLEYDSKLYFV